MTTAAQSEPAGHPVPCGLVLTLVFIGLVVAAIGSLGAPLIPSVARHSNVSLGAAQWTLTITLMTGALATPVLARMGAGPHRRRVILFTLITVVAGSIVTVLPVGFAGLLAGRELQGIGVGLTSLVIGVARDDLGGERAGALEIERDQRAVGRENIPPIVICEESLRQDSLIDDPINVAQRHTRQHRSRRRSRGKRSAYRRHSNRIRARAVR